MRDKLKQLAKERYHSMEAWGKAMGISRHAVYDAILDDSHPIAPKYKPLVTKTLGRPGQQAMKEGECAE